jgi:predicted ATPase
VISHACDRDPLLAIGCNLVSSPRCINKLGRTTGQAIQGLKAFAEAEAHSNQVGPQMKQLRLKANLLVLLKDPTKLLEAEQLFRSAIQIERSCGAKGSEMLSTIALARLLRDTNRRDEARAMLAEIYNWFTEGFDTADLKDAKGLIDELAARS